jgi:hypothetical protein
MPPRATKNWGQADKDLLANLINTQQIDITDTTLENIEQVRNLHFWHCESKNFRMNFRYYLAAWDLEIEYSGAQRSEGGGKMQCLLLLIDLPVHIL